MRTLTRVQIHMNWQNVYQSTTNLLKVCSVTWMDLCEGNQTLDSFQVRRMSCSERTKLLNGSSARPEVKWRNCCHQQERRQGPSKSSFNRDITKSWRSVGDAISRGWREGLQQGDLNSRSSSGTQLTLYISWLVTEYSSSG